MSGSPLLSRVTVKEMLSDKGCDIRKKKEKGNKESTCAMYSKFYNPPRHIHTHTGLYYIYANAQKHTRTHTCIHKHTSTHIVIHKHTFVALKQRM